MPMASGLDGILVLTRSALVAALLSVFGTLAFRTVVVPRAFGRMPPETVGQVKRRLLWMTQAGAAAGLAAGLAWLVAQAGSMADAASAAQAAAALPSVLEATVFGHLIAFQLALLLAVAAVAGWEDRPWRQRGALGLAAVALGAQAWHGHAASMQPASGLLVAAGVVHLLGAGAWLGGLLPLLLVVRDAPARGGAAAARWFTPLGKLCVAGLAASSLVQGWVLVGSLHGLFGTAYGWMALVKLGLFGVLLGFAVLNRYHLAPALLGGDPALAKRALVRSIAVQTGFGLAIVLAAGVLSSLPPAMHEQPV